MSNGQSTLEGRSGGAWCAGVGANYSRETAVPYQVDIHIDEQARLGTLADDVRRGLTSQPKFLPPKYFYDSAGSALFDRITDLPEYYLTRVEDGLIRSLAEGLMQQISPEDVVELGSGSSSKIRRLFDTTNGARGSIRYVPVDVDPEAVRAAAMSLMKDYPFVEVHAVIGDFERHLRHIPPSVGRRLVVFFGSTIGNLDPPARNDFLLAVRRLLRAGDRLLLGVDLVKDIPVLEAAYNDSAGVTRDFNRNILLVVNRGLSADFQPEAFHHHAYYNQTASRIEMHLVPVSLQTVHVQRLGLTIEVSPGESIWTENSYKFTQESTRSMLEAAGLRMEGWHTDSASQFALTVAAPA